MNLLLTGATGYLGSHLAKAFLADGHAIVALKRHGSSLRRLGDASAAIRFYDVEGLDFSTPFTQHGVVDAVIHTATCYGRAGEPATEVFEVNTAFPLRLLQAAAFFKCDTFFNTDTILDPSLNVYALSKKQFAEWGRLLASPKGIRFVNIRLEHLYGPDDDSSKFPTWIIEQCLSDFPEIKLTKGDQRRDFVYIDDVVAAYTCLLQSAASLGRGFQECGLGSGQPVTIKEFVQTVHRLTGSRAGLLFGALAYRKNEVMSACGDNSRLFSLGWQPQISLDQGIRAIINEKR